MPDPTCPHEDCTETVTHWHDVPDGKVFICSRTKGGRCLLHVDPEIGCYAPRTQPALLDALLAAAEDAKRSHDRLCDLAETLLPESSPVKTADNPAPVVLPTVDEVEKAWRAVIARGERIRHAAQAVLDLIADRVPVWVSVEPGTTIKAGTHYRIEWDRDDPSSAGGASATERRSSFDFTPCLTDPGRYSIDPRTVPAEPEDPAELFRDALIAVTGEPLRYLSSIGTDEMEAALKSAGLDLTPRADR